MTWWKITKFSTLLLPFFSSENIKCKREHREKRLCSFYTFHPRKKSRFQAKWSSSSSSCVITFFFIAEFWWLEHYHFILKIEDGWNREVWGHYWFEWFEFGGEMILWKKLKQQLFSVEFLVSDNNLHRKAYPHMAPTVNSSFKLTLIFGRCYLTPEIELMVFDRNHGLHIAMGSE